VSLKRNMEELRGVSKTKQEITARSLYEW